MKITIIGTGGIGGYYGGLLARHGQEVTFIARGEHLKAIQSNGLQIKSPHGDFTIQPAQATDKIAAAGPTDLVLICTKTYSMQPILLELPALVGPHTAVISLQNGINAAEEIGAVVGKQHVIGGATWISAAIESPGVIRQVSQFRRVVIGEFSGEVTPRVKAIADAFAPTGVLFEISENISKVLWTKFAFIASVSGIGGLTRLPLGGFRQVPETRVMLTGLMREVESVARAEGTELDSDMVEKTLAFIDQSDPHIVPSMERDVLNGSLFELEAIIGVIGRKARKHNLPTPIADMIYASLLPVYLKAAE